MTMTSHASPTKRVAVASTWGRVPGAAALDVLRAAAANGGGLFWCEPVLGPRRIEGFQGLGDVATWSPPKGLAIVEGKLFLDRALLHVVAEDAGARWAAWWVVDSGEGETGNEQAAPISVPPWVPADGEKHLRRAEMLMIPHGLLMRGQSDAAEVQRGLALCNVRGAWRVQRFLEHGSLQWWTLTRATDAKPQS